MPCAPSGSNREEEMMMMMMIIRVVKGVGN
jgi:hypothetical protein